MNLGAFMDPEYPIFSTTLCYLERDDAYLMLHRIKKQDDYNHDKWVGVGGKFERFESPEDCLVREVREETGLTLTRWRCRGLLTFVWGNMTEFIHLYTADGWQGEMVQGDACKEGVVYGNDQSEVFLGRDFNSNRNYSENVAAEIDAEMREIIEGGYQKSKDILEEHMDQLHLLAKYLMKFEKIDSNDFEILMKGEMDSKVFENSPEDTKTEENSEPESTNVTNENSTKTEE